MHFAQQVRKLPVGHIGAPQDVAAVIVFLASDLAKQVTGAEYAVNGGSYVAA
ncbi:MAG: SDR family oxidoreductase [Mycolicibacterium sp.]|nr:SDR family oxidoreductase [Mycolicibacterium sp.]